MRHLRRLLPVPLLLAAAAAQNDYDLDKATSATLGSSLQLAIRNAPANALLIVMPSFTAGPTPIALLDPNDLRSLQIGTDLFANWSARFTDGAGSAGYGFALPNVPGYSGTLLRFQTMTLPGVTTFVDEISNDVLVQIGAPLQALPAPATLSSARAFAVGVPFGNELLIAGGGTGSLTQATGLATTEIWDSRRLRMRSGATMASARALHVAVTLNDGRTLVMGGADATGTVLASCELYDPATNTWSPAASMASPRVMHSATRLPDGRVMVAGGTSSLMDVLSAAAGSLATVEIYDPATNAWSGGPSLSGRRLAPALTTLSTGRVMVSGGVQVTVFFGIPTGVDSTNVVQLYNPATNAWSGGAPMPTARAGHHYNQVVLGNGRVLMTGGVTVSNLGTTSGTLAAADVYDPAANAWTPTTMANARSLHSASLLRDGRVAVCGGAQGTLTAPQSIAAVDLFDPTTNAWTPAPPLQQARSGHTALVQSDGLLVLFGGAQTNATTTASIETLHF